MEPGNFAMACYQLPSLVFLFVFFIIIIYPYFSMTIYVVFTQWNHFGKLNQVSTYNICFHGEIRKIFIWIPLLFGAMNSCHIRLLACHLLPEQ